MGTSEIRLRDGRSFYCLPDVIEGDCLSLEPDEHLELQRGVDSSRYQGFPSRIDASDVASTSVRLPWWKRAARDTLAVLMAPAGCVVTKPEPVSHVITAQKETSLVEEAIALLKDYKLSKETGQPPKLKFNAGDFLMRIDFEDPVYAAAHFSYLDKWRVHLRSGRREVALLSGSYEAKVKGRMNQLYSRYLKDYARGKANICDVLSGDGANCEGESKFVLADFLGVGLEPREPDYLGFQSFEDHIQPVIFNRVERTVWDLLYGRRTIGVADPIYHQLIFAHAYLLAKGVASPVTEQELLLADVDPLIAEIVKPPRVIDFDRVNPLINSNTRIRLPQGQRRFNHGPVPERVKLRSPYENTVEPSPVPPRKVLNDARIIDDLKDPDERSKAELALDRSPLDFLVINAGGRESLFFKNKDHRDTYRLLINDKARRNFLIKLSQKNIATFIDSEKDGLKQAMFFLSSAHDYVSATGSELDQVDAVLRKLRSIDAGLYEAGVTTGTRSFSILFLIDKKRRALPYFILKSIQKMSHSQRVTTLENILRGHSSLIEEMLLGLVTDAKQVVLDPKNVDEVGLSSEAMIDLLLVSAKRYSWKKLFERWTPQLSEAYRNLPSSHWRDELFGAFYLKIAIARRLQLSSHHDPVCASKSKQKLPVDIALILKDLISRYGRRFVQQWHWNYPLLDMDRNCSRQIFRRYPPPKQLR